MTRRLTRERLATMTLRRQFPRVRGRRRAAVVELYQRLGPVQTQVPRAAFLFAASRLPGVPYAEIVAAFESEDLVKGSNLRGTVHSSKRELHPLLDAVSRRPRALMLRNLLGLDAVEPETLTAEIERIATDWIERDELVAQVRDWLAARAGSPRPALTTAAANLVWGHSALVRRPPDQRWETRTDTWHRHLRPGEPGRGSTLLDGGDGGRDLDHAHDELVRLHLGAYGPATRRDVAWWMGVRLRDVDRALDRLGDAVVRLTGPGAATYLDLAEPPRGGSDPGTVLLPEYDGLLLGYEGPGRGRFLDPRHLPRIWRRENGMFSPGLLHDGRVVGTWRMVNGGHGHGSRVEVIPFEPVAGLDERAVSSSAAAVALALALELDDLRVLAPEWARRALVSR
ncbi:DNA glycosylase AlkZ-like family protein [Segeticoccus rhizosphaerae]|uniref:DNA glycosylase AlkZ-like family protein n=3 Tax=Segeticoccus rhizosphaerae TaxID=1104777 RepID=UPI0010C09F48|nr:crosslink repair DNA glycosylase YcaQ family protein [Ornithinicoccus soli]